MKVLIKFSRETRYKIVLHLSFPFFPSVSTLWLVFEPDEYHNGKLFSGILFHFLGDWRSHILF